MASITNPVAGKRVVVGVCGGIAAYKAVEIVRLLSKLGADVQVAMTRRAQDFVGALTFQTLTGHRVFTDPFDLGQESEIGHIRIADQADLFLVAPATANTLARLAAGMADDPISTIALATRAPTLVAPAMNVNMWEHPRTQANLATLTSGGRVKVIGPGTGFLACRWTGPGRLAEPADIVEAVVRELSVADLLGKHLVISAGPTHESIDAARYLANRSSGKMGYALAQAALRRGARVRLVAGPTHLDAPLGADLVRVGSAAEMGEALADVAQSDAVIMAAAVADYRPTQAVTHKLKKDEFGGSGSLALTRNDDLLAEIGRRRAESGAQRPLLIGFAAETGELVASARAKLTAKGCDLVVANDVSAPDAGFSVDTNRVVLVDDEVAETVDLGSKIEIAHRILDRVVEMLDSVPKA